MRSDSHSVVLELILNKKFARNDCSLYRVCIEGLLMFSRYPRLFFVVCWCFQNSLCTVEHVVLKNKAIALNTVVLSEYDWCTSVFRYEVAISWRILKVFSRLAESVMVLPAADTGKWHPCLCRQLRCLDKKVFQEEPAPCFLSRSQSLLSRAYSFIGYSGCIVKHRGELLNGFILKEYCASGSYGSVFSF